MFVPSQIGLILDVMVFLRGLQLSIKQRLSFERYLILRMITKRKYSLIDENRDLHEENESVKSCAF